MSGCPSVNNEALPDSTVNQPITGIFPERTITMFGDIPRLLYEQVEKLPPAIQFIISLSLLFLAGLSMWWIENDQKALKDSVARLDQRPRISAPQFNKLETQLQQFEARIDSFAKDHKDHERKMEIISTAMEAINVALNAIRTTAGQQGTDRNGFESAAKSIQTVQWHLNEAFRDIGAQQQKIASMVNEANSTAIQLSEKLLKSEALVSESSRRISDLKKMQADLPNQVQALEQNIQELESKEDSTRDLALRAFKRFIPLAPHERYTTELKPIDGTGVQLEVSFTVKSIKGTTIQLEVQSSEEAAVFLLSQNGAEAAIPGTGFACRLHSVHRPRLHSDLAILELYPQLQTRSRSLMMTAVEMPSSGQTHQ